MWGTRMQVREIGAAAAGTCGVRTAGAAFKDTSKSGKHAILAILGILAILAILGSMQSLDEDMCRRHQTHHTLTHIARDKTVSQLFGKM